MRDYYDVVVVGGGIVGVFATLDLALRGASVLLLERRSICSGTSGKSHGMLHSGARYATTDPKAAVECIRENRILSENAPHCIRDVGGIFVSVRDEEEEYHSELVKSCKRAEIPVEELDVGVLRSLEPYVNREARSAILVPDKVIYARDLAFSVMLLAMARGAGVLEGASLERIAVESGQVVGVEGASPDGVFKIGCRGVINAAGPWCGEVASKAGLNVEVIPAAGVMGVANANLTRHIINRMRPPSDGDIIVPYAAGATIAGTTAKLAEDQDRIEAGEEDVEILLQECGEVVPALRSVGFSRLYASVRPLIAKEGEEAGLREITRSFEVIDHAEEGLRGFVTAVGGKLTTGRLIAEKAVDSISQHVGVPRGSFTERVRLEPPSREEALEIEAMLRAGEVEGPIERLFRDALESIDAERQTALTLPLLYAKRLRR
ncbi:MAG: FAD-dependent oxidoreductase [Nitrososphaerota archaeon]|nr:FAD-dependent oxidoreductase [Candidatus Calditenuaceae archaeon]MDW8072670.1 FAD-dependent oxidoreductase [Nitrososphaerota archaeon]